MFDSLRARYYLVVVGIATIPILLLGLFAGLRSATELERQSFILQRELAMRVERDIASFVSARQNELRVLERTNGMVGMDDAELAATLGRLLAHNQVYQDLLILNVDGQIRVFVSRTDISPRDAKRWFGARFAQPSYWRSEDQFVGPIEYDADLREPLIEVALPILERRTGEVAGIILARVRFKPIWDLLADIELPEETEAFVVNAQVGFWHTDLQQWCFRPASSRYLSKMAGTVWTTADAALSQRNICRWSASPLMSSSRVRYPQPWPAHAKPALQRS